MYTCTSVINVCLCIASDNNTDNCTLWCVYTQVLMIKYHFKASYRLMMWLVVATIWCSGFFCCQLVCRSLQRVTGNSLWVADVLMQWDMYDNIILVDNRLVLLSSVLFTTIRILELVIAPWSVGSHFQLLQIIYGTR